MTLICDPGDRYIDTYYNGAWVQERRYESAPDRAQLEHFFETGDWEEISELRENGAIG